MFTDRNYSLLTDLYQLTMGYGYWKTNKAEQKAVFNLFFRKNPFKGNYAIAAGMSSAFEYLQNFKFTSFETDYLASLKGNDAKPLFEKDYLDYLKQMKFSCTVRSVQEGEIVFANQPLIQLEGPLIQCQILETALLNIVNFQTLIATKASRVCTAAAGDFVMEFGLRRAQGVDGALAASKAAFVGGCDATSNVLAGQLFDIPVRGTHAHAWVMAFEDEQEAFDSYAAVMPNNTILLVDTYDTVEGVKKAIITGQKLKEKGYTFGGVRLDSGDLAELSKAADHLLKEAGFHEAKIVASNDLDEYTIVELKKNGAKINVWGVGTNLVTAKDQPALGGVYKLGAILTSKGWENKVKLSEQVIKISNPGILQVNRYTDAAGNFLADNIVNTLLEDSKYAVSQTDGSALLPVVSELIDERHYVEADLSYVGASQNSVHQLLHTWFENGKQIKNIPSLTEAKTYTKEVKKKFNPTLFSLENPSIYPVGLEKNLFQLKAEMVKKYQG